MRIFGIFTYLLWDSIFYLRCHGNGIFECRVITSFRRKVFSTKKMFRFKFVTVTVAMATGIQNTIPEKNLKYEDFWHFIKLIQKDV